MNGRVARRLDREYSFFTVVKRFFTDRLNKKGERIIEDENRTTFVCKGPRRAYLDLKKGYIRGHVA